jgi:Arc/MetJ-type ribon-helix-helix transcriptional regulator
MPFDWFMVLRGTEPFGDRIVPSDEKDAVRQHLRAWTSSLRDAERTIRAQHCKMRVGAGRNRGRPRKYDSTQKELLIQWVGAA